MNTILDYVHRWASECPEKPAIISRDGVISYRELYDRMSKTHHPSPITQLPIPLLGEAWDSDFCLYTTGTTGKSKGVVISQKAVISNSENLIAGQGFTHDLVFIIAGSMEHLGCWSKIFPVLMLGATIYVIEDGMKDIDGFFKAFELPLEKYSLPANTKFATFLVPSNIRILLQFASDRLEALADRMDFLETGAAPMPHSDMLTLIKFLVRKASFSPMEAETIYSIFSTWAQKFNMIVLAISSGIIVSLIPNLTESLVKEEKQQIHKRIVQGLNVLLYLTIPLTLGISFLAEPIWNLFYGSSIYGPNILSYYIFVGLFVSLFTFTVIVLQSLKDFKIVFISLLVGVLLKVFLNNKLLFAFYQMRFPAYYGAITATIIGYFTSFFICLIVLQKKYSISFESVIKNFVDIMCSSILMIVCLVIVRFFVPFSSNVRIHNLWFIIIYTAIGMCAYFGYSNFCGLTKKIFGNNLLFTLKKMVLKK